nr:immunoglobulin light chain junction region [Macaca mulatta]
CQHHNNYPRTF